MATAPCPLYLLGVAAQVFRPRHYHALASSMILLPQPAVLGRRLAYQARGFRLEFTVPPGLPDRVPPAETGAFWFGFYANPTTKQE